MKVLLLFQLSKFRSAASFAFDITFGAAVDAFATPQEAIAQFEAGTKYDLIVVEYPHAAEPVLEYMQNHKVETPVIVYLAESPANLESLKATHFLGFLKGTEIIPSMLQLATPVLTSKNADASVGERPFFCRVHADLFKSQVILPCDVYIPNEKDEFSAILKKGENFQDEKIQRVVGGLKTQYFFVRKEQSALLLDIVSSELDRVLSSPNLNPAIAEQIAIQTQEMTSELIQRVGLTPEVLAAVKKNVVLTIQSMGASPNLKRLMSRILLDRKKYISAHSVALAQVSCALSAGIEWNSSFTYQKLVMASFFHDVTLDDQDLAMVQSKADLEKVKGLYSEEVIKEYLLHPMRAADLMKQSTEIPPDVYIIVGQHHERPDGSGFPRGLTQKQIAPLAAIFIVAHDLVSAVYKYGDEFDIEKFIASTESIYSLGNFKKAHRALSGMKDEILS